MHRRTYLSTFKNAQELRHNLTPTEAKLWGILRSGEFKNDHFRRQHAVGPYVVDFFSLKQRLVIEVDGDQHRDQHEYDTERTEILERKGYRVLRFWNEDVENNFGEVVRVIKLEIQSKTPG